MLADVCDRWLMPLALPSFTTHHSIRHYRRPCATPSITLASAAHQNRSDRPCSITSNRSSFGSAKIRGSKSVWVQPIRNALPSRTARKYHRSIQTVNSSYQTIQQKMPIFARPSSTNCERKRTTNYCAGSKTTNSGINFNRSRPQINGVAQISSNAA